MFCLRQKDLARQSGQDKMDDLTTRQIAFVISGAGAGSYLAAADLQEIGGELETRLQKSFPRQTWLHLAIRGGLCCIGNIRGVLL